MTKNLKFKVSRNVILEKGLKLEEGAEIRFYADDVEMFKGYIFQNIRSSTDYNEILVYDQLRYLNNKDSFYFKNMKASDIIKNISAQFKINVGQIDDTPYVIPLLVCDNKTIWKTFSEALELTERAINEKYIIYDDFGKLMIKNVKNIAVPLLCTSEDKTMLSYNLKTDIDTDTYNKIKIFKKDKSTKLYSVLTENQGDTINKWGVLQHIELVDDEINLAQAKEIAQKLLLAKNRKSFELSVLDIGNIKVRAGVTLKVKIKDNEEEINSIFYVSECVHQFQNNEHTMRLDLTRSLD